MKLKAMHLDFHSVNVVKKSEEICYNIFRLKISIRVGFWGFPL
jgi:hypothetical protein